MIDTLLKQRSFFRRPKIWEVLGLKEHNYLVMTLHRPSNVEEEVKLKALMDEIVSATDPLHPWAAKILAQLGIEYPRLCLVAPLGYLEFNYLVERAKAVITDSGGITEETAVMNIPCMTLRDNTERPETVSIGTNELLGTNPKMIRPAMEKLFREQWKKGKDIPFWDGKTAKRIVEHLLKLSTDL